MQCSEFPACHLNQGSRRFFEIAFLGLGRIGPSRVTEVSEREVGFLLAERMGIDSKREGRVGVAKLIVTFQPLGVGEVSSSIAMGQLLIGRELIILRFSRRSPSRTFSDRRCGSHEVSEERKRNAFP